MIQNKRLSRESRSRARDKLTPPPVVGHKFFIILFRWRRQVDVLILFVCYLWRGGDLSPSPRAAVRWPPSAGQPPTVASSPANSHQSHLGVHRTWSCVCTIHWDSIYVATHKFFSSIAFRNTFSGYCKFRKILHTYIVLPYIVFKKSFLFKIHRKNFLTW